MTTLPLDGTSSAFVYDIEESEGNIYIMGEGNSSGGTYCWKNGEIIHSLYVREYAEPYDMAVSGSDVYIAACEYDDNDWSYAIYWKNGEKITLSDSFSGAFGVEVVGDDIYVAGIIIENMTAMVGSLGYWKNGDFNTILSENIFAIEPEVTGMAVSGSNVYICGTIAYGEGYAPVYWKNEEMIRLAGQGEAYDILVDGEDVYVAGSIVEASGREIAVCWKNGEAIELMTEGDSLATGITLVD